MFSDSTRDFTYAPPEALYKQSMDTIEQRFAGDIYQLGAIAVYLFTQQGMTTQLMREIPDIHHWKRWRGDYEQVLPYLTMQFDLALSRIEETVDQSVREHLIDCDTSAV